MKIRVFTLLLALVCCGLFSFAQAQDINLTGYTLTFDDEFNSLSISASNPKGSANWFAGPANGYGNFSSSNWNINAFSVASGILTDQAYYASPPINGQNWQSGLLISVDPSSNGFSQLFGYFEVRCQMPNAGTGAWPAFWLDSLSGIPANNNEEIDIFEWYGTEFTNNGDLVQQTSHNWNSNGSQNTSVPYLPATAVAIPGGAFPWQGYHIYGCQVDPTHVTWYIDGVQTNQIGTPSSYMTTNFYVELDYALGGGWPLSGTPFTTNGSSSFLVDWVRVYSLPAGEGAPLAPTGLGATPGSALVSLIWTAGSGATTYNVYRGTSPGGESSTPITTGITSTLSNDTSVTNGTTYYYKVAAVNSSGTSGYSNEASATPSSAGGGTNPIGIQFQGSGTALLSTDSAGVSTVAQTNWNVLIGSSWTSHALVDGAGTGTTATISGTANGVFHGGGSSASPAGNAKLASGEIWNGSTAGSTLLTVSSVPYSMYDVYVYVAMDASGRPETVKLTPSGGSAQYYSLTTEGGGSAWTAATSTWNGTGTQPSLPTANYVHYTGLTASSFSVTYWAAGNGGINGIQIIPTVTSPTPTAAVSRMTQGSAGTFDIPINVAAGTSSAPGSAPVECRNGTTLSLVVTFNKAMTSGSAAIGAGTATVGTPTFSGSTMTIPLSGVTNAQALQVNLTSLQASDGTVLANAVVTLRELIGDTTGDGVVNGADLLQTQSRLGQTVSSTNFRSDVTGDGQIGGADLLLIQSKNPSSVP